MEPRNFYDDEIGDEEPKIRLLDRISSVKRTEKGYELCFGRVTRDGNRPRIDLRYFGPDGTAGSGVSLDKVDLMDLLRALVQAIKWQQDPENIAF